MLREHGHMTAEKCKKEVEWNLLFSALLTNEQAKFSDKFKALTY